MSEKVAVIGLGYVGLPVAMAFAREYECTIAFDINERCVSDLNAFRDDTREVTTEELRECRALFTANGADLKGCTAFVVAVPTPIDDDKRPDLRAVVSASETVGRALS